MQNETDLADIVEQVLPDVLIIAMDLASADSRSGKVYSGFRKWSFAEPVRIPRLQFFRGVGAVSRLTNSL